MERASRGVGVGVGMDVGVDVSEGIGDSEQQIRDGHLVAGFVAQQRNAEREGAASLNQQFVESRFHRRYRARDEYRQCLGTCSQPFPHL